MIVALAPWGSGSNLIGSESLEYGAPIATPLCFAVSQRSTCPMAYNLTLYSSVYRTVYATRTIATKRTSMLAQRPRVKTANKLRFGDAPAPRHHYTQPHNPNTLSQQRRQPQQRRQRRAPRARPVLPPALFRLRSMSVSLRFTPSVPPNLL
jgi:hypothetical protein